MKLFYIDTKYGNINADSTPNGMPTVINSAAEAECESGLLFKFLFPCLTPLS
jgi:hypothetical protein